MFASTNLYREGVKLMKKILKWGVLIFVGLIVLGVIIGAGKSGTNTSTSSSNQAQEPTKTQEPTKAQEVLQKQWVAVLEVSGASSKKTDSFVLKGGKQRITYTFAGNDPLLGFVYLMREGTNKEQGAIYDVMAQKAGTDETISRKSAGTYYLDITAVNASWTIKVEEER